VADEPADLALQIAWEEVVFQCTPSAPNGQIGLIA
jgi:hypothetical protein